ncbi:MAG: DUF4476 domain-containing protein [Chitinophagales bacterium]|nr:DUF4476 domain-containing protein [Chitinophagales bacterium]MDW8419679.1 DUF4476 domain-containing protein [Chitinophagales bacterium]
MKSHLTFWIFTFCTLSTFAQPVGHLTVFSEDGDKFYLIINGERQNNEAQTNIRVEDLTQPQYRVKIIFENTSLGEISRNIFIANGDGQYLDVTYRIKRDKNTGKPKLGALPFSAVPVTPGFIPPPNTYVVHWGAPATPPPGAVINEPVRGQVTQTTTTTTTTTNTSGIGTQVNVGGVNVGISVTNPNAPNTVTTTTTTTTTTTGAIRPTPTPAVGCVNAYPMSHADFTGALATIRAQNFDDTRLKTARQIAQSNCLSATQIADICKIFSFEENRLAFAKFAYPFCADPGNYHRVNSVFNFSSSSDELNDYIMSRPPR